METRLVHYIHPSHFVETDPCVDRFSSSILRLKVGQFDQEIARAW